MVGARGVEPELANVTVGRGGMRFSLLNELAKHVADRGYLVVSDDDAVFTRGSLPALVALCERGASGSRPACALRRNSRFAFNVAHAITRARRLYRIRLTTFVETGPLVVVGPRWRDRNSSPPRSTRHGLGRAALTGTSSGRRCVLGIVDAVRVAHLGEQGSEYDAGEAAARVHEELAQRVRRLEGRAANDRRVAAMGEDTAVAREGGGVT